MAQVNNFLIKNLRSIKVIFEWSCNPPRVNSSCTYAVHSCLQYTDGCRLPSVGRWRHFANLLDHLSATHYTPGQRAMQYHSGLVDLLQPTKLDDCLRFSSQLQLTPRPCSPAHHPSRIPSSVVRRSATLSAPFLPNDHELHQRCLQLMQRAGHVRSGTIHHQNAALECDANHGNPLMTKPHHNYEEIIGGIVFFFFSSFLLVLTYYEELTSRTSRCPSLLELYNLMERDRLEVQLGQFQMPRRRRG